MSDHVPLLVDVAAALCFPVLAFVAALVPPAVGAADAHSFPFRLLVAGVAASLLLVAATALPFLPLPAPAASEAALPVRPGLRVVVLSEFAVLLSLSASLMQHRLGKLFSIKTAHMTPIELVQFMKQGLSPRVRVSLMGMQWHFHILSNLHSSFI